MLAVGSTLLVRLYIKIIVIRKNIGNQKGFIHFNIFFISGKLFLEIFSYHFKKIYCCRNNLFALYTRFLIKPYHYRKKNPQ